MRARRAADPPRRASLIEKLEAAIADAAEICSAITAWENRWSHRNLVDQSPDGVSERAKGALAKAEAMTLSDYRAALIEREAAQLTPCVRSHRSPMRRSPSRVLGRRRIGRTSPATVPRPTGDSVFN